MTNHTHTAPTHGHAVSATGPMDSSPARPVADVSEQRYQEAVAALKGALAMDDEMIAQHCDAILSATCPNWMHTELAQHMLRTVEQRKLEAQHRRIADEQIDDGMTFDQMALRIACWLGLALFAFQAGFLFLVLGSQ